MDLKNYFTSFKHDLESIIKEKQFTKFSALGVSTYLALLVSTIIVHLLISTSITSIINKSFGDEILSVDSILDNTSIFTAIILENNLFLKNTILCNVESFFLDLSFSVTVDILLYLILFTVISKLFMNLLNKFLQIDSFSNCEIVLAAIVTTILNLLLTLIALYSVKDFGVSVNMFYAIFVLPVIFTIVITISIHSYKIFKAIRIFIFDKNNKLGLVILFGYLGAYSSFMFSTFNNLEIGFFKSLLAILLSSFNLIANSILRLFFVLPKLTIFEQSYIPVWFGNGHFGHFILIILLTALSILFFISRFKIHYNQDMKVYFTNISSFLVKSCCLVLSLVFITNIKIKSPLLVISVGANIFIAFLTFSAFMALCALVAYFFNDKIEKIETLVLNKLFIFNNITITLLITFIACAFLSAPLLNKATKSSDNSSNSSSSFFTNNNYDNYDNYDDYDDYINISKTLRTSDHNELILIDDFIYAHFYNDIYKINLNKSTIEILDIFEDYYIEGFDYHYAILTHDSYVTLYDFKKEKFTSANVNRDSCDWSISLDGTIFFDNVSSIFYDEKGKALKEFEPTHDVSKTFFLSQDELYYWTVNNLLWNYNIDTKESTIVNANVFDVFIFNDEVYYRDPNTPLNPTTYKNMDNSNTIELNASEELIDSELHKINYFFNTLISDDFELTLPRDFRVLKYSYDSPNLLLAKDSDYYIFNYEDNILRNLEVEFLGGTK